MSDLLICGADACRPFGRHRRVTQRQKGQPPGGIQEHIDFDLLTKLFDDSRFYARIGLGTVALVGIADLGPTRRTGRDGAIRSTGPGLAALAVSAEMKEALGRLVVPLWGWYLGRTSPRSR